LIDERAVHQLPDGGAVAIGRRTLVTPLARDLLQEKRVTLRRQVSAVKPLHHHHQIVRTASARGTLVVVGNDHGGLVLKPAVLQVIQELGLVAQDIGCHSAKSVDYPDYAERVGVLVAAGAATFGIVIDGAGIGSCMAANKVPGVRAALAYDLSSCQNAREHNNANVLTLGARLLGEGLAESIVRAFLTTPFAGGRHQKRIDKISAIEQRMRGGGA
jgi:ribose 5-phosphate isomerase B